MKIKDQLDGEKSFKYQDQMTLKKLAEEVCILICNIPK